MSITADSARDHLGAPCGPTPAEQKVIVAAKAWAVWRVSGRTNLGLFADEAALCDAVYGLSTSEGA